MPLSSPGQSVAAARAREVAVICRAHSVAALYAFGSRGKEALAWMEGRDGAMAAPEPDLDLAALPKRETYWGARAKVELTIAFEDLFGVCRVDLVVLPEAPPFLASQAIQGERLYATDEDQADEYDLYVLRRAGDLLPFHRQRIAMILGESK